MHMVWINLIPQLFDLRTGNFNNLDDGTEDSIINPSVWSALGNMCRESGITIPSSFGCHVPNLSKHSNFMAESWSPWATQLVPNLLQKQFTKVKYYEHFVTMIKLMKKCVDYSLDRAELPSIHEGFAKWVMDYEE
jgi:hypothetical protein